MEKESSQADGQEKRANLLDEIFVGGFVSDEDGVIVDLVVGQDKPGELMGDKDKETKA